MSDMRGPIELSPATTELHLVGVSFYEAALKANEGEVIVSLIPEPTNPYDPNAIAAYVNGQQIGHVPKEFTSIYGQLFAAFDARGFDLVWAGDIGEWEEGVYARFNTLEIENLVRALDQVDDIVSRARTAR